MEQRQDEMQEMPEGEQGETQEMPTPSDAPEETPARDPQSEGMPEGDQGEVEPDDGTARTEQDIQEAFE